MRVGAKPDGLTERIGLLANLLPTAIGESMFAMPVARSLQVAQRTGMFAALAERPHTADQLARRLDLQPAPTALVLDVLVSLGHVKLDGEERYELAPRARRWLEPGGDRYVGDFLADNYHYWEWWGGLERLVREGHSVSMHDRPADDPYWRDYIRGQYQLARLSSDEVAKAIALPGEPSSVLDVAGAHGEFSMALCRRHPGLEATIVDLPGSARIGREIVAEAGMADRLTYVEGDMFEADLAGPHDGALCFNIIHHLSPEQTRELFARIRGALRPGAPLCVLDLYDRPKGEQPRSAALLGLFFYLTSGADTYSADEVSGWLADSGYGAATRRTFRTLPDLALLRAEAR
ncbi:MAG TPA: class I SAM-dependent methyltransferase [Solirubrobacterales bacterium]|nr:class I SAM-dependent methyltransferase [Solirubrobacterales bacterium]